MLELRSGRSVVTILPELGGAVGSWTRDGTEIMHPVSDPKLLALGGAAVAAYPLIPFSNRVGYGRFSFDGKDFQLDPNFGGEPHTIHGNAWMRSWRVEEHTQSTATLVLEHLPPEDPAGQWPFRYRAMLNYALTSERLTVVMHVHNIDARRQPVGMGFHPFFPRTFDLELGFTAGGVWITGENALPERRDPAEREWRFSPMRAPSGPPIDNCYSGWDNAAFLRWPSRNLALSITADTLFDHLVLFTPPGKPFVAVEPATNMTDAINHPEIADRGLSILEPDEEVTAHVTFELSHT
ncbi:MAG: aldose 1-epimerase [Gluconacetobacter diazotrophicus]|nr:aldose 1-epimerase [Gluconacetobacter diazotrophicus]